MFLAHRNSTWPPLLQFPRCLNLTAQTRALSLDSLVCRSWPPLLLKRPADQPDCRCGSAGSALAKPLPNPNLQYPSPPLIRSFYTAEGKSSGSRPGVQDEIGVGGLGTPMIATLQSCPTCPVQKHPAQSSLHFHKQTAPASSSPHSVHPHSARIPV